MAFRALTRKELRPLLRVAQLGLILVAGVAHSGCNFGDKKTMRFLSLWNGSFVVSEIIGEPNTPEDQKRHSLKGYLKVLSNKQEFWLHLEGEQQKLDLKGTYKIDKNRIRLRAGAESKIDDFGGEDARNPNRKWIPLPALKDSYARPIILDLSEKGDTLTGLPITIGPLKGKFVFDKAYK